MTDMIPKTIHYCWFSEEPLPPNLQMCMRTWKKRLPEYTWRLWTLRSFDADALAWTKEALEAKAWAFLTDYVRLYALYTEGGIYLDTDVWVNKSFDSLLGNRFFTAIEYHPEMIEADALASERLEPDGTNRFPGTRVPGLGLQAAILGAEKGHPYLEHAMNFYHTHHFIQPDGSWYTKEIAPDILALAAEKFGLKYDKDSEQTLQEGMKIYPYQKLCGAYIQVTAETIAAHLSAGGWRKRTWLRTLLTRLKFYKKIFRASRYNGR